MAEDVKAGIYRHFKGPLYRTFGIAHDANHPGRTCMVYVALQLDGAHPGPRFAVRNRDSSDGPDAFTDQVTLPDGRTVDRFTYLGPELTADMLTASTS